MTILLVIIVTFFILAGLGQSDFLTVKTEKVGHIIDKDGWKSDDLNMNDEY